MPNADGDDPRKQWIYLAGPLFSVAEKTFNLRVCEVLSRAFEVYLPQRDGLLLADLVRDGVSPDYGGRLVFEGDVNALRRCDILLIVLDGRTVDEGAAFELGLAFGLGKECYGLQTDPRRLLPWGNNPMIAHSLKHIITSLSELEDWVKTHAAAKHLIAGS